MNVVWFLISTLLLGLLLTPALGDSASPFAKSYRLQRLAIRSSSSGAERENKAQQEDDPYNYLYENPGDAAHLYQATANIVDNKDTTNRRQDNDDKSLCTGMTLDLSLHIANRFHATLCLTPDDNTNNNNNNKNNNNNQGTPSVYHVKLVGGRMSSTRMYAVDANVRALETQWNAALPQVTLATLQAETLTLRGDNPDKVEIRFQAIQNNDQSITDQGSA